MLIPAVLKLLLNSPFLPEKNMDKPNLLIVDDDKGVIKEVGAELANDFDTDEALSLHEAMEKLSSREYSVVVADRKLADTEDGPTEIIKGLESKRMRPEMVVLTGHPDIPNANELFRDGIFSYIEKASGSNVYDRLKHDCGAASRKWYQRNRKIPDSAVKDTMAILFGDILSVPGSTDMSGIKADTPSMRNILDGAAWRKGGYLIKLVLPTFLVAFDSVSSASDGFEEIKDALKTRARVRLGAPLHLHAVIGWGKVTKVQGPYGDELEGPWTSETFKHLDDRVPSGTCIFSPSAERQLAGKPPAWVEFALQEADRLANASLPADLAQRHDDHSIGDTKS
jgi:ActR/RegA family two-component response regulator